MEKIRADHKAQKASREREYNDPEDNTNTSGFVEGDFEDNHNDESSLYSLFNETKQDDDDGTLGQYEFEKEQQAAAVQENLGSDDEVESTVGECLNVINARCYADHQKVQHPCQTTASA